MVSSKWRNFCPRVKTHLFGQCIKAGINSRGFGGYLVQDGKGNGCHSWSFFLSGLLSYFFFFSIWSLTESDRPRSPEISLIWKGDIFPLLQTWALQDLSPAPRVRNFFGRNLSALTCLDFGSSANCLPLVFRPVIRLFAKREGKRSS